MAQVLDENTRKQADAIIKGKGLLQLRVDCASGKQSKETGDKTAAICRRGLQQSADAMLNGVPTSHPDHPYALYIEILRSKGLPATAENASALMGTYYYEVKNAPPNADTNYQFSPLDKDGKPIKNSKGQVVVLNLLSGLAVDSTFMYLVDSAKKTGALTTEFLGLPPMIEEWAVPDLNKCFASNTPIKLSDCRRPAHSDATDYAYGNLAKISRSK